MKLNLLPLIIALFFVSQLNAQSTQYSRVKINLENRTIDELAGLGLDAEHGDYQPGKYFTSDFSTNEIQQITAAGFEYTIEIADVIEHYVSQNRDQEDLENTAGQRTVGDCQGVGFYDYYEPENFELGSMGGFLTYQEMLDNLDAMHAQYPNLISERTPIGPILTHEDRPIYWLRISDNPNVDEEEPEVFYNALHHAREPNGLSQIIYYMWYLLERYETDPEVQYLLNNTEMYFVPMINPDGYIYNETTNPNGGGLWRKNKRDNNTNGQFEEGEDGVDLNRNYGYEWAFDDYGSSGFPGSAVYRGPSAFSEPELQNVRDFCNEHEFQIALNYHTYGNLLIYPWGYADETAEPIFLIISEALNRENKYLAGTGSETVGYQVNGVSDDWMFGESVTKPPIFSLTPEVGYNIYGFWPPANEIVRFCKSTVLQNLTTAHLVLNYGIATDMNPLFVENIDGTFEFDIRRFGLLDGALEVSLSAGSPNIAATGPAQSFNLVQGETATGNISYSLNSAVAPGEAIQFVLSVNNGTYTQNDTITKFYSIPEEQLGDDLSTDDMWTNQTTDDWGLETNDFYSAPSCMSSSPGGDYSGGDLARLVLNEPISLLGAETAMLSFWCKWETERYRDYAQVQVSIDNGATYEPVCGLYTTAGTNSEDFGEPVYDGVQMEWVQEQMDLSEFIGEEIIIRFVFDANNNFQTGDGFLFDDISVSTFSEIMINVQDLDASDFGLSQNHPNPANSYTVIDVMTPEIGGTLYVCNTLGAEVYVQDLAPNQENVVIPTLDWEPGVYFYSLKTGEKQGNSRRMLVIR